MAKDKSKPKKEALRKRAVEGQPIEDGGSKKEKVSTRSEPTKKLACTCRHTFQDET